MQMMTNNAVTWWQSTIGLALFIGAWFLHTYFNSF